MHGAGAQSVGVNIMRRFDHDTQRWVNAELDPKTGAWKTIERDTSPYYHYGLFPLIRELHRGTRKVKWIGFKKGWEAALYHDAGTDFIA